jgi:hypothetical protein
MLYSLVRSLPTFRKGLLPSPSRLKSEPCKEPAYPLFDPEIEGSVRYSEMSVGFNRTTRSFIPKDSIFSAFKRFLKTL